MVYEVSNWNKASLTEIVTKTSSHHWFVTEIKSRSQCLLTDPCEFFASFEIGYQLRFQLFALNVHMRSLFNERATKPRQLVYWPINSSLWLGQSLKILFPLALLRKYAVIHHKNAKDIELGILWSFIIEQIIVFFEQFAQPRVIIAFGCRNDKFRRYSKDESLMWYSCIGGYT